MQNDTTDTDLQNAVQALDGSPFNMSIAEFEWDAKDMEYPINSAAVARLKIYAVAKNVPMTLQDQANLWVLYQITYWAFFLGPQNG